VTTPLVVEEWTATPAGNSVTVWLAPVYNRLLSTTPTSRVVTLTQAGVTTTQTLTVGQNTAVFTGLTNGVRCDLTHADYQGSTAGPMVTSSATPFAAADRFAGLTVTTTTAGASLATLIATTVAAGHISVIYLPPGKYNGGSFSTPHDGTLVLAALVPYSVVITGDTDISGSTGLWLDGLEFTSQVILGGNVLWNCNCSEGLYWEDDQTQASAYPEDRAAVRITGGGKVLGCRIRWSYNDLIKASAFAQIIGCRLWACYDYVPYGTVHGDGKTLARHADAVQVTGGIGIVYTDCLVGLNMADVAPSIGTGKALQLGAENSAAYVDMQRVWETAGHNYMIQVGGSKAATVSNAPAKATAFVTDCRGWANNFGPQLVQTASDTTNIPTAVTETNSATTAPADLSQAPDRLWRAANPSLTRYMTAPGWASGAYISGSSFAQTVTNFGVWRGSACTSAMEYFNGGSSATDWTNIEGESYWPGMYVPTNSPLRADGGAGLVISIPIRPGVAGSTFDWAGLAAGTYDAHFVATATFLKAAGLQNAMIRLGWEANGSYSAHFPGTGATNVGYFVSGFQHAVTALRSVTGTNFKIIQCWAGGNQAIDWHTMYAGDAYVDIVSFDDYDIAPSLARTATPAQRWAYKMTGTTVGIQALIDFAVAHGKLIAFDEWGCWQQVAGDNYNGGGDNAYYIAQMYLLLADLQSRGLLSHENYFDTNPSDGAHMLTDSTGRTSSTVFPLAAAEYRRRWVASFSVPIVVTPPPTDPGTPGPGWSAGAVTSVATLCADFG
jgi:hypothetical protein